MEREFASYLQVNHEFNKSLTVMNFVHGHGAYKTGRKSRVNSTQIQTQRQTQVIKCTYKYIRTQGRVDVAGERGWVFVTEDKRAANACGQHHGATLSVRLTLRH